MTANQAIHCSCGLVFDNRGQATQHIEYVRDILRAGDAHTVIDETSAGETKATAAPVEMPMVHRAPHADRRLSRVRTT